MTDARQDAIKERVKAAKERVTRDWEGLLAIAARRLIRLDHGPAALALAESSIVRMVGRGEWSRIDIEIEVSGDHYDALTAPEIYANDEDTNGFGDPFEVPGSSTLARVFTAVLPTGVECESVEVKIRNEAAEPDWREQVRAGLESGPSNQGRPFGTSKVITHSGLNYRSKAEVAIAEKLEMVPELLFFPNSAAVTGKVQKEPDFLVFYKGRVGILEVSGPTHTGRLADDSLRDSFFQRQRIFVKHYTAEKCSGDPGWVVKDFLGLLLKAA
jgi:hypothetical protein